MALFPGTIPGPAGACLIQKGGLDYYWVNQIRNVRDVILNFSMGRLLVQFYYNFFG